MHAIAGTQTRATILLVDDDRAGRAFLAENLAADGYEVIDSGTSTAAQRALATRFPDLALIRVALRNGGLELVAELRETDRLVTGGMGLSLIVVSEEASELDRLRCYERGCDELVCGAPSYAELRARVAAMLRRPARGDDGARLHVGPLVVEGMSRQVWVGGERVELSSKEFSLLRLLASEPSRVFTREELLRTVWGWEDPAVGLRSTRTLDSHASRLRRKLSIGGLQFVINVWGIGYRLTDATISRQLLAS